MDEVKTIKSQRVKTPVNHALAIVNRNNNSTLHYFHYFQYFTVNSLPATSPKDRDFNTSLAASNVKDPC